MNISTMRFIDMPIRLMLLIICFHKIEATTKGRVREEKYKSFPVNVNVNSHRIATTVNLGYNGSKNKCAAACHDTDCSQFAWKSKTCYLYQNSGTVTNADSMVFYRKESIGQHFQNGYILNEDENVMYTIHSKATTFVDATTICTSEGGRLLIIDSESKQDVFENILTATSSANTSYVLVDGSDQDRNGKWTYSDGTEFTYDNWHVGRTQPNTMYGNGCLALMRSCNFQWHDISCTTGHWDSSTAFICEIDMQNNDDDDDD